MSRLLLALLASAMIAPAFAAAPFVIKDIRVEGIQRTEPGTVFSYVPFKVGDSFTDELASDTIRALYATGFFKDVRVDVQGDVVVISIEERPAIAAVSFVGNKEFDTDTLKKALRDVGIAEARIYDKAVIDRAEQEIKSQYLTRSKYGAKVATTITPIERNRVNVTFTIDEGEVAKIQEIRFIGNKAFSDRELRDQIVLRTPGWFTFFTKDDQYSRQKLSADLESLRSFYLNRGYLEFNIESSQVSISPDRQEISITVNLFEGEKYTVSDIKVSGETLGRTDELRQLIKIKSGETFNGDRMTESVKAMTDRLGAFGFAFATVNPQPNIDRDKRTVAFDFFVDPGRRAYVRRVNVVGNTRTRDEVIRREVRQFESAWYDSEKIRLSRDRVDRLAYFDSVNVDTSPVPGTADQIDVTYTVKEKATGQIAAAVGYNSTDKLVITASISQANVFGSGKTLGAEVNTSRASRALAISTVDPYFTVDGVSRSIDFYTRTSNTANLNLAPVRVEAQGASMRFGVPFTDLDTVFFGLAVERNRISNVQDIRYQDYILRYGEETYAGIGTLGWGRDSRNSGIAPTKGGLRRFNAEVSGGDLTYYKLDYQEQLFWPVTQTLTLALNTQATYADGLGKRPYPFFKNLYAGGIGSVRGFEGGTLGPKQILSDGTLGNALGGTKRLVGNLELQIPVPGQGKEKTARMFAFVDTGYLWGENERVRLNDMRFSAGVGLTWLSPVGPLKLSYGRPLVSKPGDRVERFQFQVGTGF